MATPTNERDELVKQLKLAFYKWVGIRQSTIDDTSLIAELLPVIDQYTASRVAEADDKAHLIGFKNGKFATTKRLNDLWTTIIIDDVGAEKAFAYREAIEAYLQQPKESEEV